MSLRCFIGSKTRCNLVFFCLSFAVKVLWWNPEERNGQRIAVKRGPYRNTWFSTSVSCNGAKDEAKGGFADYIRETGIGARAILPLRKYEKIEWKTPQLTRSFKENQRCAFPKGVKGTGIVIPITQTKLWDGNLPMKYFFSRIASESGKVLRGFSTCFWGFWSPKNKCF